MANLGETTEIVNASELTLKVGSDTYILFNSPIFPLSNFFIFLPSGDCFTKLLISDSKSGFSTAFI